MKKVKRFLNFFPLIVVSFVVLTACNQEPKDIKEQMKNYETAWMEGMNNGDAHALAMQYTADAKLFPANSAVIEGKNAVEAFWNGAIEMGKAKVEVTTVAAQAVGELAVQEGEYKSFTNDGQMIDQGKYLISRIQEEGQWKINKHIWNTSIPEPPIMGAWNLVEIHGVLNGSHDKWLLTETEDEQIKTWTNTHFSFIGSITGEDGTTTDHYGGGTYTLSGNDYVENVKYNFNKSYEGTTVKMHLEIKNDTLIQTYPVDADGNVDNDNYYVEKYVRLD